MKHKIAVGVIFYNHETAKYLPYFLQSIKKQTTKDFVFLVADNSSTADNENRRILNNLFSTANIYHQVIENHGNIGFGAAFNKLITLAEKMGAKYFLALNVDMILNNDVLVKLSTKLDADEKLGAVGPKILQWDFLNKKKTHYLDTMGIALYPGLRFVDIGQGQMDMGQFDKVSILGPSGAAAMYRLSALEEIKERGAYFDELMFMYKEDCDLAYRLYLAGYTAIVVPEAIIYHDRSVSAGGESDLQRFFNRWRKSRNVKKWSFLNQLIIYTKYWPQQSFRQKTAIVINLIKIFLFITVFEQYLFKQILIYFKIKEKITVYKENIGVKRKDLKG